MNKLLLITKKLKFNAYGGREKLCYLNYETLKLIYGNDFYIIELEDIKVNSIRSVLKALYGYIDGINNENLQLIISYLKKNDIKNIFIDGSNLGLAAKNIKSVINDSNIYVFFHNVESKFFWDSFCYNKSVRSLLVFIVNYFAEKKSIKYATKIICLNSRDSEMLYAKFNRCADYILSLSIKNSNLITSNQKHTNERYALFVGGLFYANIDGIDWFLKNVSNKINYKIIIIGKGFEKHKIRLKKYADVEVIGEVNDVGEWYLNSEFVIAPIFSGSGMKTKVAEALMYGKMVYGTDEAFSGYENLISSIGVTCNSAFDFINAINKHEENVINYDSEKLKNIYLNNYSEISYFIKLKKLLIK